MISVKTLDTAEHTGTFAILIPELTAKAEHNGINFVYNEKNFKLSFENSEWTAAETEAIEILASAVQKAVCEPLHMEYERTIGYQEKLRINAENGADKPDTNKKLSLLFVEQATAIYNDVVLSKWPPDLRLSVAKRFMMTWKAFFDVDEALEIVFDMLREAAKDEKTELEKISKKTKTKKKQTKAKKKEFELF